MQRLFDDFTLVTQKVDNLHRLAGSENILELHGNIYRNKCVKCQRIVEGGPRYRSRRYPRLPVMRRGRSGPMLSGSAKCSRQRSSRRPSARLRRARYSSVSGHRRWFIRPRRCPWLPAVPEATLVEVNPDATPLTDLADFHLSGKSGEVLPELVAA